MDLCFFYKHSYFQNLESYKGEINIFMKVYILFRDEVKTILYCIPNHSSIDTKLQFLKQFIPDILKLNPGSLAVVATWTLATVHLLELERKEWPENGLNFAQQVI